MSSSVNSNEGHHPNMGKCNISQSVSLISIISVASAIAPSIETSSFFILSSFIFEIPCNISEVNPITIFFPLHDFLHRYLAPMKKIVEVLMFICFRHYSSLQSHLHPSLYQTSFFTSFRQYIIYICPLFDVPVRCKPTIKRIVNIRYYF